MPKIAVTDEYFEEVRKRVEAATIGPWNSFIEGRDHMGGDSFICREPIDTEEDPDLYLHDATIWHQAAKAAARAAKPAFAGSLCMDQSFFRHF